MKPKCLYCKGSCGCGGEVSDAIKFCCDSCKRDYDACREAYPDAVDPVAAHWGERTAPSTADDLLDAVNRARGGPPPSPFKGFA